MAFKERWWDYSEVKWNLDGYICLPASALWGVLGYVMVRWGNNLTWKLFRNCFLPDHDGILDEQKQSCMGTFQYHVGICACTCYLVFI